MLGFGSSIELLDTKSIEDELHEGIRAMAEGEEAWIITPYSTMDKLGTIRRAIVQACSHQANVKMVVRDEPEQVQSAVASQAEAIALGLEIHALHRLHAKLYWFENQFSIVTSANLVDGSFESSTELGLLLRGGGIHDGLREWIQDEIEPRMRLVSDVMPDRPKRVLARNRISAGSAEPRRVAGHCIRCGTSIPVNVAKPYCLAHFKSWSNYSNPDYTEKYCHTCGTAKATSMAKPQCYECFRKKSG